MTTMTQKKKKKGRPSLLDLQKRALKQQQQEDQSQVQRNGKYPDVHDLVSNNNQRTTYRNPNVTSLSPEWTTHEDDDDERKEKKLKPLTGFNSYSNRHVQYPTLSAKSNSLSFSSVLFSSDSNADGDDPELASKKCKISAVHFGSANTSQKDLKATDCSIHGSQVESGPTMTPLPDKKLLLFILDRVQKKDTYGVFSEPVDREELPDYHDIIENPMEFSTVRKKLDEGAYVSLEDLEKDVFLICSNAMQYNEPDTIYFRQARSMQELARKDFENLRQDGDDSDPPPKVVRRGRPPGKSLKKSIDKFPIDLATPVSLGDEVLASGGDSSGRSNTYNLRKCTLSRFRTADASNGIPGGTLSGEACISRPTKWENEFPASVERSVLKFGKKQFSLDENRRDTYKHSLASGHGSSIWAVHEEQRKLLMPVGLFLEQDYARSLALFAADLGPVAWKIASKKIESVLPGGLKFSPGSKSANKGLNQDQSEEKYFSGPPRVKLANWFPQSATGSSSVRGLNSQHKLALVNSDASGIKNVPPIQAQRHSNVHFGMNDLNNGRSSHILPQMMSEPATLVGNSWSAGDTVRSQMSGIASISSDVTCPATKNYINSNETMLSLAASRLNSRNLLHQSSGTEFHRAIELGLDGKVSLQHKDNAYSFPTDLNITFQGVGLPDSGVQICSPQQPDLALQL